MGNIPDFDVSAVHRHFSVTCFNKAWELIEKPDRTPEEDEEMIRLSHASLWHWMQREDCTSQNLSIGYWQASRIHALLGRADEARRYGQLCLRYSQQEKPFYLGYAYEALARAEKVAGYSTKAQEFLAEASRLAVAVADPRDRKLLLDDLADLAGQP